MADTIVFLQLEHGTISRLLNLIEAHRQQVEAGDELDLPTLALIFDYFRDYPDACHHPKEDVVFRRLQHRDPVAAAELGDLLGGHHELEALTVRVAGLVEAERRNGAEPTPELMEGLREFVDVYRRHLESEDSHFFPTARAKLTREDWDLIDFTVFECRDPLYDERAENRFQKLRRLIWASVTPSEKEGNGSGDPD